MLPLESIVTAHPTPLTRAAPWRSFLSKAFWPKLIEMGFTRTLVILSIGVVIPLVMAVFFLIEYARSTPRRFTPQNTARGSLVLRDAAQDRRVKKFAL